MKWSKVKFRLYLCTVEKVEKSLWISGRDTAGIVVLMVAGWWWWYIIIIKASLCNLVSQETMKWLEWSEFFSKEKRKTVREKRTWRYATKKRKKRKKMMNVPLMVALFGRIVTAPTAASSSWWMGLFLAPQLSEPIHRKWPTWSARLLAFRIPLHSNTHHHWAVCAWGYCLCSSNETVPQISENQLFKFYLKGAICETRPQLESSLKKTAVSALL